MPLSVMRFPSVSIGVDDHQRRMTILIEGEASGREVQDALCKVLGSRPEVTGYDYFFDLRLYTGDVAAGDLHPIAEVYARVRTPEAEGTRTAFLTFDANFGLWAKAMDFQFPGRIHLASDDEGAVEAYLVRSERSAPRPAP